MGVSTRKRCRVTFANIRPKHLLMKKIVPKTALSAVKIMQFFHGKTDGAAQNQWTVKFAWRSLMHGRTAMVEIDQSDGDSLEKSRFQRRSLTAAELSPF